MSRYVLITPAHNEQAFIEKTLRSVAAQTIRPVRWVVVNDASTDGTREIVERHAREHEFIHLVNIERASGRHFGNKARAFNRGLEALRGLDYDTSAIWTPTSRSMRTTWRVSWVSLIGTPRSVSPEAWFTRGSMTASARRR